ncbi:MAG: hypothetical protein JXM73_02195 [Anaerolineae bacterium]|nr:hypothetical protein [Anaerolineae bacterium]
MAHKTFSSFSLDTEADRDILRWLGRQENRSKAIRDALREHIGGGGVTLGDVYQVVKGLEQKLEAGTALAYTAPAPRAEMEAGWDEPADVAATLDALGEL